MLDSIIQGIVEFVRQHQAWAVPLVFVLSFGESLAFISLLLPATVILFALSALLGEGGVAFVPVWMAAASGAFLGDWLSYWLGYRYQHQIGHVWPLSRNPHILQRGHRYFERWGFWGSSSAVFSARCGRQCRWWLAFAPCRSATFSWRICYRRWSGAPVSWRPACWGYAG